MNLSRVCMHVLVVLAGASVARAQTPPEDGVARPLGAEFRAYVAPSVPDSLIEPTGELRLREALALALLHDPRLATFSWNLRAAEAAELQAGAWPNPELALEYENFGGGGAFQGVDGAEATLALSQLVLLGGKRGKRTNIARLEGRVSAWDYEIARIRTHVGVVRAFVAVLAAQERHALAEKIVEIATGIVDDVAARVRVGGTLALEESRARAARETAVIESALAKRQLTIARRELAAMWGSHGPRFTRAVGDLDGVAEETPSLDALLAYVDRNPEVARWTSELQRRHASVQLAKADRVPDVNLNLGLRHHNADDAFAIVAAISAPLPFWDRKGGAIGAAQNSAMQATVAQDAAASDIRRDIAVASEVLAGAFGEVTHLRDRVLPEAEAAATSSGDAYRAGAIQLTDVLDIQGTFYRLRLRYVNALARYRSAAAELEGLVGVPLTEVRSEDGDGMEGER